MKSHSETNTVHVCCIRCVHTFLSHPGFEMTPVGEQCSQTVKEQVRGAANVMLQHSATASDSMNQQASSLRLKHKIGSGSRRPRYEGGAFLNSRVLTQSAEASERGIHFQRNRACSDKSRRYRGTRVSQQPLWAVRDFHQRKVLLCLSGAMCSKCPEVLRTTQQTEQSTLKNKSRRWIPSVSAEDMVVAQHKRRQGEVNQVPPSSRGRDGQLIYT